MRISLEENWLEKKRIEVNIALAIFSSQSENIQICTVSFFIEGKMSNGIFFPCLLQPIAIFLMRSEW